MTVLETPVPLAEWIPLQQASTDDELFYKAASLHQMNFVRDELARLVGWRQSPEQVTVNVIASHTSKSVRLPVYDLCRPDGLRFVLRENFYNWKLSVISTEPVIADFTGLFHTTPPVDRDYTGDPLAPVYFEGFPRELVFGYYEPSDKRCFSAELWGGNEALWTALFLILRARGVVKPHEWSVRKVSPP
jgi:hypothetical protein